LRKIYFPEKNDLNDEKIISISFIHGFIWGDVPDLGAKLLVYTDKARDADGKYALEVASRLGQKIYFMREKTRLNLLSVEELIKHLQIFFYRWEDRSY
jgi:microcystin degradation protein MlrC